MAKTSVNLQDGFLNQVRKDSQEIRICLLDGTELRGQVKGFDNFTVVLNERNQQHLIYKHAISHIARHGSPVVKPVVVEEVEIESNNGSGRGPRNGTRHSAKNGYTNGSKNGHQNGSRNGKAAKRNSRQEIEELAAETGRFNGVKLNGIDLSKIKLPESTEPAKKSD